SGSSRRACARTVRPSSARSLRGMLPLESVPNFSEGRDGTVIAGIGDELARFADLLDIHADEDHNRSVFTLVGGDAAIVDALLAAIAYATERIDLRRHEGVH